MMKRIKSLTFELFARLRKALSGSGLSKLPGTSFLYNLFYKILRPHGIISIECLGNRLLVNAEDEGIVPYLLTEGIYEPPVTFLFNVLIKPGMTVLDVGANIGYFTLVAAKRVGENGRVFAFEPEPHNYNLLVQNIEFNHCANVTALPIALSDEQGQLLLYLHRTNLGCHSISKENVHSEGGCTRVEATTLDSFISNLGDHRVDLIKMDIQGAEGLLIKGGEETLRRDGLAIIMEFWPKGLRQVGTDPSELLRKLVELGFQIKVICGEGAELAEGTDLTSTPEAWKAIMSDSVSLSLLLEKTGQSISAEMPDGNSRS